MAGFVEYEIKTLPYAEFLKRIKPFREFRVKFKLRNAPPFNYIYFRITKTELINIVRMNQMRVQFEIRYNSKVQKHLRDIVYIRKMRMTLLDKENQND